jgi:hypothetical protein
MSTQCLIPLMYSTSIPNGGLGLEPHHIGSILAAFALLAAILQALLFQRVLKRYGPGRVMAGTMLGLSVSTAMYPLLTMSAKAAGQVNATVMVLIAVQVSGLLTVYPGYSAPLSILCHLDPANLGCRCDANTSRRKRRLARIRGVR